MALAPLSPSTRPITTRGLFNPTAGQSFEQWRDAAGADTPMPSIAPAQVDDSVANKVTAITKQDSPLMQAAATEGLKVANRRGLLNSSLAAGTAQTAALNAALPIASQDAAQDFQRNAAARQFEYGMASQDSAQAWQSSENVLGRQHEAGMQSAAQTWQAGQNALDRQLEQSMQAQQISAADRQQIRDIASREGIAAAERHLQLTMQQRGFDYDLRLQNDAQAHAQSLLDDQQSFEQMMSNREFSFQESQAALDRALQQRIANWNISSSERQAAATMTTAMVANYSAQYQAIMSNTALSAEQRTQQMQALNNRWSTDMELVEQMYSIDLDWGGGSGGGGGLRSIRNPDGTVTDIIDDSGMGGGGTGRRSGVGAGGGTPVGGGTAPPPRPAPSRKAAQLLR